MKKHNKSLTLISNNYKRFLTDREYKLNSLNFGFTLIELLAVIAILAIVMIIAVPTVLNTIGTAKKGAFKDSVLGLLKSANNATISDFDNMGEIDQFFVNDSRLNLDNKVFTSGIVIRINEKFRVFNVSNGEYCANGDIENLEITQKGCKAETTPESCFIFDKNSGGITGYNGVNATCTDVVIIPNTIEGQTVTRIENNAFKSKGLTAVLLTNNIAYVGDYAFANNKLTDNTYVVPSSSTYQGAGYFNNNALNQEAFTYLSGSNNTVIIGYAGTSKNISIPEGVVRIGDNAFRDLALTSVDFPDSLKEIGYNAFYNNKLTSLNLKNVETIKDSAFNVNLITKLSIPTSVKSIGRSAFRNNKLTDLILPNTNISYGPEVYNNNQLPDDKAFIYYPGDNTKLISYGGAKRSGIVMPSNIINISYEPFRDSSITSITLSPNLQIIGGYSFYGNQLTSITIPSTVTSIGDSAFRNNKLNNVVFLDKSKITFYQRSFNSNQLPDNQAFIYDPKDSTRLVSYGGTNRNITIPDGVKAIGSMALSSNALQTVNLPNTLITLEYGALSENSLTDLNIPSSVVNFSQYLINSNQLPPEKAYLYDPKDNTKLISYGGKLRDNLTLPTGIKTINTHALSYNGLTGTLTIPEGVTTISSNAFYWNSISNISIPSTVTSIGSAAFTTSSKNLRSVRIAGDPNRFNSIWANIGFPTHITPTN